MGGYILITGSTSGIGESLALKLSENSKLVLCGRNAEKLSTLRKRCSYPDAHQIFVSDLASERELVYEKLSDFITSENIPVESFIHCAGLTRIMPVKNFSPDFVNEIFNVNLFSALEILRSLLKKNNRGNLKNVIFISGLWSLRGDIGNSIYASSKGAINSLVLTLARELAPAVRVNSIVPGAIVTPMTKQKLSDDDFRKKIEKDYPLGLGKIEDVINMIEFLLSEKSSWITGQNLIVDGGRSLM